MSDENKNLEGLGQDKDQTRDMQNEASHDSLGSSDVPGSTANNNGGKNPYMIIAWIFSILFFVVVGYFLGSYVAKKNNENVEPPVIDCPECEECEKCEECPTCPELPTYESCLYKGTSYKHGSIFEATDGVNQCLCNDGKSICTNVKVEPETPTPPDEEETE